MLILVLYSVLLKVIHFWYVIADYAKIQSFPGFPFIAITFVQLIAVFICIKYVRNIKARFLMAFALNLLLGLFIHGSYMYYRLFAIPLDFSLVLFAKNLGNVNDIGDSIFALLRWSDIIVYSLDIAILLILPIDRVRDRLNRAEDYFVNIPTKRYAIAFVLFIAAWYATIYPVGKWYEPFSRSGMAAMVSYGPIGFAVCEISRGLLETFFPQKLDAESAAEIRSLLSEKNKSQLQPVIPFKAGKLGSKPDIFIIQVEALMSGFLHESYDGVPVMPELSYIASNSIFLPDFFSHAISTADSDFTTLTSLLPLDNRTTHLSYFANKFASLPGELKKYGYHCIYGNGVPKNFWNVFEFNQNLGFDEQFSKDNLGSGSLVGNWLSDETLFEKVLVRIASSPPPLMCMLLTVSSHHPFNLAGLPETISVKGKTGAELEKARYANAINYADKAIGKFIKDLDRIGRLGNSVVIIYGDHPVILDYQKESLRARYGHLPAAEKIIRFFNSNIPCMIYAPGILKPQTIAKFCGQIDLAPTILSILGKEKPARFLGNSIFLEGVGYALHKYWLGRTSDYLFYGRQYYKSGFEHCFSIKNLQPASLTSEIDAIYSLFDLSERVIKLNYSE